MKVLAGFLVWLCAMSLCSFCFAQEVGEIAELQGVLSKDATVVRVDAGKVPMGAEGRFKLKVLNDSGLDIDASVKPSCACTSMGEPKLIARRGAWFETVFGYEAPATPGLTAVDLVCQDEATDFRFTFTVVFESVSPVRVDPEVARVPKSDKPVRFLLRAIPNFDSYEVTAVEVLECDIAKRQVFGPEGGDVELNTSGCKNVEQVLPVRVAIKEKAANRDAAIDANIKLKIAGLAKIIPQPVTFRLVDGKVEARINIAGYLSAFTKEQVVARLSSGDTQIPMRVLAVKERSDMVRSITLQSFGKHDQLDTDLEWEVVVDVDGLFSTRSLVRLVD